jgi:2-C-methyl-D-erythritol 4-phosphate cytidylyltransferase
MKRVALIVAGGSGTRMGTVLPKQFLLLNGKAILLHSVEAFRSAFPEIKFIVVLPEAYLHHASELIAQQEYPFEIELVLGGETRFDSVKNGLSHVADAELIFVHDAVRCLVSPKLIQACSEMAAIKGSAIPVVPVRDSMRRVSKNGNESSVVDRDNLYVVQTPQTFSSKLLLAAFQAPYTPLFTDEASVVEADGHTVSLIAGEESNIKITYSEDLDFAAWKLSRK